MALVDNFFDLPLFFMLLFQELIEYTWIAPKLIPKNVARTTKIYESNVSNVTPSKGVVWPSGFDLRMVVDMGVSPYSYHKMEDVWPPA